MSLSAIASGPTLGIFSMGVLLPWINARVSSDKNLKLKGMLKWITNSNEKIWRLLCFV